MKYIRIKVLPSSKKSAIIKIAEDVYEIKTKSKAESNNANKEALGLLSERLNIKPNKLRIISGHKRPNKIIEILNQKSPYA